MKKILLPLLLLSLILVSACSNDKKENTDQTKENDMITYESENGPIEVPADPQRVVVLSSYVGDLIQLDVPIVGADAWSMKNTNFEDDLKDVEEVSDESLEKIIELDPDLIIGLSNMKNYDKLSEIAPTVTFTYGNVDYLQQHIEIGKVVNKEEEATAWVDDFKERAAMAGDEIKAEIGEDTTISVVESFDKQLYVYGDNWGRGTEILYQEMGLAMPEKVKEMAQEDGYYALSLEVLPDFAGDYLLISHDNEGVESYLESDVFKNIPAVKNDHVLEVDMYSFYFNDATTLEYQLAFFEDYFLDK